MKTKPILEAEEPSVIPESACFVEQIATDWSPELLAKLAEIPWLVNVVEWLPEPKQYLQELPERGSRFPRANWLLARQASMWRRISCSDVCVNLANAGVQALETVLLR